MVMEQIVVFLVDPYQNLIFVLLLTTKLDTFATPWAISDTPTHLTYVLAWEK
jgi:hypothetical protein